MRGAGAGDVSNYQVEMTAAKRRQIGPLAVVVALAAGPSSLGEAALPAAKVEALTARIQGKGPDAVRALIIGRFGPPARRWVRPPNRAMGRGWRRPDVSSAYCEFGDSETLPSQDLMPFGLSGNVTIS